MRVLKKTNFREARDALLAETGITGVEKVDISKVFGRVLSTDIRAAMMIPHYDRSPFDGYALRSADVANASEEHPVTLRVLYEIKAGDEAGAPVGAGEAVKILTGAPIPAGADCVQKYEDTVFDARSVTLKAPLRSGQNIVRAGEDVKAGRLLAGRGTIADVAVTGMLASQGMKTVDVYKKLRLAVISTGNELTEVGDHLSGSSIYNTNRYMLAAELTRCGFEAFYAGLAGDDAEETCELIAGCLDNYDGVIITGGVSAGDYDVVPEAMEKAGVSIRCHGVKMKPGMACAYGFKNGKPCIALSGNPASAMTNFYCIAGPLLRKYAGEENYLPEIIRVKMTGDFAKGAKGERLIRGRMTIVDGVVTMEPPADQGNAVISSMAGANLMVIVPSEHGPVHAGDVLDGFMI